jgi:hypothetical protein
MATTTPKDPILQEHTRLVRTVESNLKVKTEDAGEIRFRSSLFNAASAQLSAMNPTLVTRLYEAVCGVEFPKPEMIEFRKKLQFQIGKNMGLAAHRTPAAKG